MQAVMIKTDHTVCFQNFLQEAIMSDAALSQKFASLRSDVTAAPAGALPDPMDTTK